VTTAAFTRHAQAHAPVPLDGLFAAWLHGRALPRLP
jgi:hypothetical protein